MLGSDGDCAGGDSVAWLDVVARRRNCHCRMWSARRWFAGRNGARVRRRWRCAAGSCWRVPMGCPTRRWPTGLGFRGRRWVSGVPGSWRRLKGLVDEERPGAPRKITDEKVEEVVVATLEQTPKDATHWSRASMAKKTGLSKSSVGRIWKAFR